jgi:hypothetical protein
MGDMAAIMLGKMLSGDEGCEVVQNLSLILCPMYCFAH